MNLIEALKTGKPLRRKGNANLANACEGWLNNRDVRYLLTAAPMGHAYVATGHTGFAKDYQINDADLLADDWEVQRLPREWTMCLAVDKQRPVVNEGHDREHCSSCVKVREVLE